MSSQTYVVDYLCLAGAVVASRRIVVSDQYDLTQPTYTQADLFAYLDTFARSYARHLGAASFHVRKADSKPQAERPAPSNAVPWRSNTPAYEGPASPRVAVPGGYQTMPTFSE